MSDTEWNKKFVAKHFDELVNRKDLGAVERNFAADFIDHDGPGGQASGVAEGLERLAAGLERFPDMRVELRDIVAEGDRVMVRAVWSATEKASGTRMEMHGFVLWRIADGKLAERWAKTTSMSPLEGDSLIW